MKFLTLILLLHLEFSVNFVIRRDATQLDWRTNPNEKAYYTNHELLAWYDANRECQAHDGELLTIEDENTQDIATNFIKEEKQSLFWTGLVKDMSQKWRWDGENTHVQFTNWDQGEPRGKNKLSPCALMSTSGRWKVADCDVRRPSICQKIVQKDTDSDEDTVNVEEFDVTDNRDNKHDTNKSPDNQGKRNKSSHKPTVHKRTLDMIHKNDTLHNQLNNTLLNQLNNILQNQSNDTLQNQPNDSLQNQLEDKDSTTDEVALLKKWLQDFRLDDNIMSQPSEHPDRKQVVSEIGEPDGIFSDISKLYNNNTVSDTKDLHRESTVYTYGGSVGEDSKCKFPFTHDGKTVMTCITDDREKPWCAVTSNYDHDAQWGYCKSIEKSQSSEILPDKRHNTVSTQSLCDTPKGYRIKSKLCNLTSDVNSNITPENEIDEILGDVLEKQGISRKEEHEILGEQEQKYQDALQYAKTPTERQRFASVTTVFLENSDLQNLDDVEKLIINADINNKNKDVFAGHTSNNSTAEYLKNRTLKNSNIKPIDSSGHTLKDINSSYKPTTSSQLLKFINDHATKEPTIKSHTRHVSTTNYKIHKTTHFQTNIIRTYGGNSKGKPCVFPFVYDGDTYFDCIELMKDRPWCSTTSSYDRLPVWGYCCFKEECTAPDVLDLSALEREANRMYKIIKLEPSESITTHSRRFKATTHNNGEEAISIHSGLRTYGGNADRERCQIPFVYDGQTHMKCIPRDDGTSWCATTHSYDKNLKWGNCCDSSKCVDTWM